jgi:hypothetical protein
VERLRHQLLAAKHHVGLLLVREQAGDLHRQQLSSRLSSLQLAAASSKLQHVVPLLEALKGLSEQAASMREGGGRDDALQAFARALGAAAVAPTCEGSSSGGSGSRSLAPANIAAAAGQVLWLLEELRDLPGGRLLLS